VKFGSKLKQTNKYKQIMDTGKHTDIHYGKNNDKRKKDENNKLIHGKHPQHKGSRI